MHLTPLQTVIMILAIALGTQLTRFAPFLLFPEGKRQPAFLIYLGKVLPAAMMGLLVVYCFKNVSFAATPHGAPELIASLFIVALHAWRGNVLLSIGGGTAVYMLLIRFVFA